jgi:hypothetical protein
MKEVRWVVDKNLLFDDDFEKFKNACEILGIEFCELESVIMDEKINFYYADIPVIRRLYKESNSVGVFFNEDEFTMENYLNKWGENTLNPYAKFTTLNEFSAQQYSDESFWFIKPNADGKKFAGTILPFKKIKDWQNNIKGIYEPIIEGETQIMISPPSIIKKEWRNFIVDGKVVTSSVYKYFFEDLESPDAPEEVIKFAEDMCNEYQPSKIFVMDVALCGDKYYIVECNCINCSAPYKCDIDKLVEGITNYIKNNINEKHTLDNTK